MTSPGLTLAGLALVLAILWANLRPACSAASACASPQVSPGRCRSCPT